MTDTTVRQSIAIAETISFMLKSYLLCQSVSNCDFLSVPGVLEAFFAVIPALAAISGTPEAEVSVSVTVERTVWVDEY